MEQIHQEYDGQWVFMINCEKGEYGLLAGGEVVVHSYSKEEVLRGWDELEPISGLTSFQYAGKIPEETIFVI